MKAITDTLEVARSHQYETTKARTSYTRPDDGQYLALIHMITDNRPTYGYRRTTALVNRALEEEGKPRINHKRIYRLMKLHHLLLERHTGRRLRILTGRSSPSPATCAGALMGSRSRVVPVLRCGWSLVSTVPIGKS